jgi:hypothetical protein
LDLAMKIRVDIDCTPDEARRFFGLPDVAPMQEAAMAEIQKRMVDALAATKPEELFKTWLPAGLESLEKMQRAFWSQMAAASGKKGPPK